jgi:WD40 repeat protein/serine/threonine protein kinase
MTPDRFKAASAVVLEALPVPHSQRLEMITERCGSDLDLLEEVLAMLKAEHSDDRIDLAAGVQGLIADAPAADSSLKRIGQYQIIRCIGTGGMGRVFEARQDNPARRVAIKLLHGHLSSANVVRRFLHEAQILGHLQHVGIAHVYEAGEFDLYTHSGTIGQQPFLAMEFIKGSPLTQYAAEHQLDVRARIALFCKVCDAIQHAHQKGVIHRDLKPANILVDPSGQPKVLDFGIARLTDSTIPSRSVDTSPGQLLGTLPYMSPEQLAGQSADLDTRSDVYALGVVLFELLVGHLPRDLTPTAVGVAGHDLSRTHLRKLSDVNPSIDSELDLITATALRWNMSRRYQSASDLAADLRRHLQGEPIAVKRDSAMYVLSKTLTRYRRLALTSLAIVAALASTAMWAHVQAQRNRVLADQQRDLRHRADATALRLAAQLSANDIERGRLLARTDHLAGAEELIWPHFLENPEDPLAYWALWESYSREPCLQTLGKHKSSVDGVVISPDTDEVASCGRDDTIRLWRRSTGRCVATLTGHDNDVTSVHYIDDGRRLISSSLDGTIKQWDRDSHDCIATVRAHAGGTESIAVARNSHMIASCGRDATIKFWDSTTMVLLGEVHANQGRRVLCVAYSPDGQTLASGGADGSIGLWSITDRSAIRLQTLRGHTQYIRALAYSQDGTRLASGSVDRTVRLWDAHSGDALTTINPRNAGIRWVAFSADGSQLMTGGRRSLDWWSVRTGQHDRSLAVHNLVSAQIGALNDHSLLAIGETGGHTNWVRMWESKPNRCLTTAQAHAGRCSALQASPDGLHVATGGQDGRVLLWDAVSRSIVLELDAHEREIGAVRFSPCGRWLASASYGGLIRISDTSSGMTRSTMRGFSPSLQAMHFATDGTLWTGNKSGTLIHWDPIHAVTLDRTKVGDHELLDIRVSPDGGAMLVASRDSRHHVLDPRTGTLITTLPSTTGASVSTSAFANDGSMIATGNWGMVINLWSGDGMQLVSSLSGHRGLIRSLAFVPGSPTRLVSGSADGTIKLWDTDLGRCLVTLESDHGEVLRVDVIDQGPNTGIMVAAYEDGSIGWWDMNYYDRHITGNLNYAIQRYGSDLDNGTKAQVIRRVRRNQSAWRVGIGNPNPSENNVSISLSLNALDHTATSSTDCVR